MRRTITDSDGNTTMGMGMHASAAGTARSGLDVPGHTSHRVVWIVLATLATVVMALGATSTAQAAFGVEPGSFVAGTYQDQAETMAETQAGTIPFQASTGFSFTTESVTTQGPFGPTTKTLPQGNLKSTIVDLPAGLSVNPQATPRCPRDRATAYNSSGKFCPPSTQVGIVTLTLAGGFFGGTQDQVYPVYNMVPRNGDAAELAFMVSGFGSVKIVGRIRSTDFGLRAIADNLSAYVPVFGVKLTLWGVPAASSHDPLRDYNCTFGTCTGVFPGIPSGATPKPFLRNMTVCDGTRPKTRIAVDSWRHPAAWNRATTSSPKIEGCDKLSFNPSMDVQPDNNWPDSPTGLDVNIGLPQTDDPNLLGSPDLKKVQVTLPEGMTINPSGAGGLTACSDAQLKLKSDDPVACPASSKIGTVEATSPLLSETLTGGVYIRSQNSMDPESGEMFRLALVLENKDRGISVRLTGSIKVDAHTGRLVTTFDNNPQLPVSNIKLHFKSGARAPLATPKACGPKTVNSTLTSWAGQSRDVVSHFQVACTPGLGWFGPYFSAGTVNPVAGTSSPFVLRVAKPDGQSDLNGLSLELPEGLLGYLKGNLGTRVGTARVAAGPGASPYWLSGPVYLEGAYGGAPFSLKVVVPAVAGPFNLGNVVVRQKLFVDPHDAHVTVVSDPLPTIVKGVPVRLQDLAVDIDKAGFMRNPTSCAPKVIHGALGAMTGQLATVASRFQVGACSNLPLKPKMRMELEGKDQTKRGKHPTLVTTLTQQAGESALKKVKVRLPLSLALDPDNAQALCKPAQAAAHACPAGSIVGKATAITPMLDQPLAGNVYFVEGTRKSKTGRTVKTLPKLWVALRGQVAIDLWADSAIGDHKELVTTFGFVPDAPISSFRLDIDGGEHGILAVTGDSGANLCQNRLITDATFDGQNGKQVTDKVHMGSPCGFGVQEKSVDKTHAKVTVSGLGAGKLSISGKGIHKASRTIKHSDVATIRPRLNATGKRLYAGRKAIRLRVSFDPKAKGEKTRKATTVVKRAKQESSTRAHRSR